MVVVTERAFKGGGFSELLGRSRFFDTIPLATPPSRTCGPTGTPAGTGASTATRETTMHPPKHEIFDLTAGTNTDPKGIVREVDEYRLTCSPSAGHHRRKLGPVPLPRVLAAPGSGPAERTSSTSTRATSGTRITT